MRDEALVQKFENVLSSPAPKGRQKEQVVQEFLEENTTLIPMPLRLHQGLHFEAIISKFSLGLKLDTDYIYITKNSGLWQIDLVELECPEKPIFTANTKRPTPSAEFNAALAQVRSWQLHVESNREEILSRLDAFLRPINMRSNPIRFRYQLIIGRSDNKNFSAETKKHFAAIEKQSDISLLTYDMLVGSYRNDLVVRKNVMKIDGGGMASFKHMHFLPSQILSYVGPDKLSLSNEEIARLRADYYEIDKWKKGELLTYNIRMADSTFQDELKSGRFFNS